jgi:outer membrane protein assembly factor BamB
LPTGGVVVSSGNYLEKVDVNGSVIWKYNVGSFGSSPYNQIVSGANGTLYFSQGDAIVALSTSDIGNGNTEFYSAVTFVSVMALIICVIFLVSRRPRFL